MAEHFSRQKLWVVEANLFIISRYICLQSFMTVGQRGQEICLFKINICYNGCYSATIGTIRVHFVFSPSLVIRYHCGKFHKKRLDGFGCAGVFGGIIII